MKCIGHSEETTARRKNEKKKRIRIPDEVLFMIIDACTPRFSILIRQTHVSIQPEGTKYQWQRTYVLGPVEVAGIPDLTYLKLIKRRFYNQVFPAICANFNGKLLLEAFNASGTPIISRANDLFTGRLSSLAPRVTKIYDWLNDPKVYSQLRFDLFSALKLIESSGPEVHHALEDFEFWNHDETKIEQLDDEVLARVAQNMADHALTGDPFDVLRRDGVRLILRCHFRTDFGSQNTDFYVDSTRPKHMSVVRRQCYPSGEYGAPESEDSDD